MSKFNTLAKTIRTLMKYPDTLKRALPAEDITEQLSHDDIYDIGYFQFVEQTTTDSADVIATSVVHLFHPSFVVDVGCGTGALPEQLRSQGVKVKGLEYAEAALNFCWMRQLDVVKFDVVTDQLPADFGHADVVISMEVGQQLPEASADRYIDLLCQIAPIVVFSSAIPGQGDRHPLNEKPHRYWIKKFRLRGYLFDEIHSLQWREEWKAKGTAPWFCQNVMIFRDFLESSQQ